MDIEVYYHENQGPLPSKVALGGRIFATTAFNFLSIQDASEIRILKHGLRPDQKPTITEDGDHFIIKIPGEEP